MKNSCLVQALIFSTVLLWFGSPASATAPAATIGKIDGLVSPAWLERSNLTVAATPGTELFAGDKLRTGKGARLILRLNEGSAVQLGENATFEIVSAQRKNNVFVAALNVLDGAFRFTTRALAKTQQRDVNIRVGNNATIGIRGTDLWGRGSDKKDIVCLIEGKIDVTGNNNLTLRLDQPLQFFSRPATRRPNLFHFSIENNSNFGRERPISKLAGVRAFTANGRC